MFIGLINKTNNSYFEVFLAGSSCEVHFREMKENTCVNAPHRRRIELEDKVKVVASDWGTESLPR